MEEFRSAGSASFSRRSFLAGTSALGLGACAACPGFEAISLPQECLNMGDAHVHFFNAADLPALGFIKYVIGPAHLQNTPAILLAIGNIFVWVLKASAISARREMGLRIPPLRRQDGARVSLRKYVDEVADQVESVMKSTPADLLLDGRALPLLPEDEKQSGDTLLCGTATLCEDKDYATSFDEAGRSETPDDATRLSMVLLATLLAQTSTGQQEQLIQFTQQAESLTPREQAEKLLDTIIPVDRASLRMLLELDDPLGVLSREGTALPAILQTRLQAADSRAVAATRSINNAFDPLSILKWGFMLRQSRCAHVVDYLDFIESRAPQQYSGRPFVHVREVVNLLVDYDYWLGDTPGPGSDHTDQIAFWSGMREVTAPRLAIHTFAGYDPLKDTYRRLEQGKPTSSYLEQLVGFFDNHTGGVVSEGRPGIQGLKLYPVMGFNPADGNCLPTCARAGARIRKQWLETHPGRDYGDELDATLENFFAVIADRDIPLLAHARPSNHATQGGSFFAVASLWERRAKHHYERHGEPLRLCLGHYTIGGTDEYYLARIMEMNHRDVPAARIYYDVSYGFAHGDMSRSEDHAGNSDTAKRYVAALADFAQSHDPECNFLLFGSDWIMVGQEKEASRYVETAYREFSRSPFFGTPERMDRIFYRNFRDFLGQSSVGTATGCSLPRALT